MRKYCWIKVDSMVGRVRFKFSMYNWVPYLSTSLHEIINTGLPVSVIKLDMGKKIREALQMRGKVEIHPLTKVIREDFRLVNYRLPGIREQENLGFSRQRIIPVDPANEEPVNQEELPDNPLETESS